MSMGKDPLYMKLYNKIEKQLISGEILPGERLAPKRALAASEGVSLNTVIAAYDLLVKNGLVYSAERRGYFAAGDEAERSFKGSPWSSPSTRRYVFSINSNGIAKIPKRLERARHDVEYGIEKRLLSYKEYTGNADLREQICAYLFKTRHISCTSEQIITASGLNELMNLISRLFPPDTIYAFEDPTEKKTEFALTGGKNIRTVSSGIGGFSMTELEDTGADVFFCMPEKQYPLGYKMTMRRREELLHWCGNERYMIEYGLCSELSFDAPLPSLYETDKNGRVIYVNTFDKVIAPGVSVAYMVLPVQLVELFKDRLWYHHSNISEYDSLLICEYISNGGIYSSIKRLVKAYRKKCAAALDAFSALPFADSLTFTGTGNAAFFSIAPRTGKKGYELMKHLAARDVKLLPVSCYSLRHSHESNIFAFGYAELSEADIREGIRLIGEAWDRVI